MFTERGHEASHCGDQLLHSVELYLPSSRTATVTFSLQHTQSSVAVQLVGHAYLGSSQPSSPKEGERVTEFVAEVMQ